MVYPTELKLEAESPALQIRWSDGELRRYTFRQLREACPCATCREQRAQQVPSASPNPLQILQPAEARPLSILGMKPVGSYAYSIQFSDGHDTGIYTIEHLRELGEPIRSNEGTGGD